MPAPRMFIVAGPPGAGKSSIFALSDFASRTFNADDRAAELNGGSYRDIPLEIRRVVNREFEQFVHASIDVKRSFALETTLRSDITFEQAKITHGEDSRQIVTLALCAKNGCFDGCHETAVESGFHKLPKAWAKWDVFGTERQETR